MRVWRSAGRPLETQARVRVGELAAAAAVDDDDEDDESAARDAWARRRDGALASRPCRLPQRRSHSFLLQRTWPGMCVMAWAHMSPRAHLPVRANSMQQSASRVPGAALAVVAATAVGGPLRRRAG